MKITPGYGGGEEPKKKKEDPNAAKKHPRHFIDEQLTKNYPGRNLSDLDKHNVPVVPGVADTPAMTALRRGHAPSR